MKDITMGQYRRTCAKMLQDFDSQGVLDWQCINAKNLTTAFISSTNKHHFTTYARRLFRYLIESGVLVTDYTGILPTVQKQKCIPSVYNDAEISQLLRSVETFTPQGKRDYAIILVALRLGLRQSDIRLLCFENVNFCHSRVDLVQLKTSVAIQLKMPNDVVLALQDYINNGREESDKPNIFLNGYGEAMTIHAVSHIVSRHFKKAKIDVGSRHSGSHSLRMTFASQMVAEKVPYEVVRVLLGHVSHESTRHYVEFSIEGLRTCALEIPEPGGILAQSLSEGV
jgi:site-specific recombinase XerD